MMELFANAASTTLNSPLTAIATSLTVNSATGFPVSGNFRIIIEGEILLVTTVLGTLWTVSRAQEGTTATTHAQGVAVTHIITAGGLVQGIRDNSPYQPAVSNHLTTDVAAVGADPTYTDLVSVTVTTLTSCLLMAQAQGITSTTAQATPRLRILVDGVEQNYLGGYGNQYIASGSSAGVQVSLNVVATGLTPGSHTFKLQAAYSGSASWGIHALSNPTRENAWLIATPLT